MLRLTFLFFLSAVVHSESPLEIVTKIHDRYKELFNSGEGQQLVQELFHEDTPITGHGYAAMAGERLVKYFKDALGQGKIVNVTIISAEDAGNNLISATVEMKQESMETIVLHAKETIKDGKFISFDMVLRPLEKHEMPKVE